MPLAITSFMPELNDYEGQQHKNSKETVQREDVKPHF
jgi:hypothetical protein